MRFEIGNSFVVAAVVMYPGMRNITNFFITSLAIADLLIIIFCLPATLMNAILTGKLFFIAAIIIHQFWK